MINPVDGLLGKAEFLPSIAGVKKWLDEHGPRHRSTMPEHRLLPPSEEVEVSPEERARNCDMLTKLAATIRATANAKCIGRPMGWKQKEHSLEELFTIAKSDVHGCG